MSNARNLANLLGTGTTINTSDIADDAITNAKILNDAVTGAKIEDNPTIAGNLTVSGNAVIDGNINDRVQLNATDGSATDAGDALVLNSSASGGTDDGENILFETGTSDPSMILTGDLNFEMDKSSTIKSEGGAVTTNIAQGLAKASCNLDGSGTATIRASFNISSVTDNDTAKFTHAFTNSFSDVNSITAGCNNKANDGSSYNRIISLPGAASASQVVTWSSRADTAGLEDPEFLQFVQHGDLA